MGPPPSGRFAPWLFERYVRHQAARHFSGLHWATRGAPERWDRSLPRIFVANHTNWWDGFLAFLVSRALGLSFQVLMEARHLERYRLFLRAGALPIRRGHPRESYLDLEAAAAYLRPGVGFWVFPQGERRPAREPLRRCGRGAAHLALGHSRPVVICPVGFGYAFVGEQLPEAFVLVGDEWLLRPGAFGDRRSLMEGIEARLRDTVHALEDLIDIEQLDAFSPLARGRLSVNKRLDRFRHAVGLLRGPFERRNG